jgi:hypothetical protein
LGESGATAAHQQLAADSGSRPDDDHLCVCQLLGAGDGATGMTMGVDAMQALFWYAGRRFNPKPVAGRSERGSTSGTKIRRIFQTPSTRAVNADRRPPLCAIYAFA